MRLRQHGSHAHLAGIKALQMAILISDDAERFGDTAVIYSLHIPIRRHAAVYY